MIYEIEHGRSTDHWTDTCKQVPLCLGTDCKSLYDLCKKDGSMPDERRVALDLMDVREGVESFGDDIRWIPTDHMLVDCLTKAMHPQLMLDYLRIGIYAFKFDEQIRNTKREATKERKKAREVKAAVKKLASTVPKPEAKP